MIDSAQQVKAIDCQHQARDHEHFHHLLQAICLCQDILINVIKRLKLSSSFRPEYWFELLQRQRCISADELHLQRVSALALHIFTLPAELFFSVTTWMIGSTIRLFCSG